MAHTYLFGHVDCILIISSMGGNISIEIVVCCMSVLLYKDSPNLYISYYRKSGEKKIDLKFYFWCKGKKPFCNKLAMLCHPNTYNELIPIKRRSQ